MGVFSAFRYLIVLFILCFYFRKIQSEEQKRLSFDFGNFGKDSNFESQFALYGDAKVVNNGSIQMSGSMGFSAGRILNKKPIKLVERNPRKVVSFSTHFVFSLSRENGDGFAFMMVPIGYPFDVFDGGLFGLLGGRKMKFLAVEFDTFLDEKYGDVNGNHVGVDLSSFVSVKVSNVSSVKLGLLNSGVKVQSWIDYEASSKRLEIRLSKLGEIRPVDALLSCPVDMLEMWKEEDELFVGLSSSSGNSTQKCNIYSWSLRTRTTPHWMHSEPLDPQAFEVKKEEMKVQSRSDCALRILGALLLVTGCGALGAFVVVIVWTILGSRRPVAPEDNPAVLEHKKESDEYKKFIVVVDKAMENGKGKN